MCSSGERGGNPPALTPVARRGRQKSRWACTRPPSTEYWAPASKRTSGWSGAQRGGHEGRCSGGDKRIESMEVRSHRGLSLGWLVSAIISGALVTPQSTAATRVPSRVASLATRKSTPLELRAVRHWRAVAPMPCARRRPGTDSQGAMQTPCRKRCGRVAVSWLAREFDVTRCAHSESTSKCSAAEFGV